MKNSNIIRLVAWAATFAGLTLSLGAMNHNLSWPWGNPPRCSPPQTPLFAFYNRANTTMMFDTGDEIAIYCQSTVRTGSGLSWSLSRSQVEKPFLSGEAEDLPANLFVIRVPTKELTPGFYDLRVKLEGMGTQKLDLFAKKNGNGSCKVERVPPTGICTFGWRADEMALPSYRPADFVSFWRKAYADYRANVPLDARVDSEETLFNASAVEQYNVTNACLPSCFDPKGVKYDEVVSYKVSWAGPDGGRVSAWLARPKAPGRYPAMVVLPGAGVRSRPRPLDHARHGYVAIDVHVHGLDCEKPDTSRLDGCRAWGEPGLLGFPLEKTLWYDVYLRAARAVDYLASLPFVDPARIVTVGGSQGGRLSVVVPALEPRVAATVPAIAHGGNVPYLVWSKRMNGMAYKPNPRGGWGYVREPSLVPSDGRDLVGAPPVEDGERMRAEAYFDPMNFAPEVKCPVLMNAGLVDPISFAPGVYAIFLRMGSADKTLVPIAGHGHDWFAAFDRQAYRWLAERLAQEAAPECGFFRKGDNWVLSGDSITHNDFYRQTVVAALDHFHPGNGIRAMNTAVWGQLTSEAKGQGLNLKPTVVTIMLGMNNVIHHDYPATYDFSSDAAAYAETIRRQVKAFQAQGARVVLLKPTLSDETEFSYFAVFHTRAGLVAYGQALEKVAAEENCDILPFADDFEIFKPKMPALATLIPDGVHPYGWGQYALARALIHHFRVDLPLAESEAARTIDPTLVTLSDFQVERVRPFIEADEKPAFRIVAPRDCRVRLRWSVADSDLRGEDVVEMKRGEEKIYVPQLSETALPRRLGTVTRLLLTLEPGWGEPRVAVADFARTRVHRMTDGRVSGKTGPAEWTMREDGSDLWLEGRVRISEWPARKPEKSDHWMNSGGMNGVKIMWDFRPLDRFAEQRYDHDVNSTEFSVLENPWSVNSQAWINRRVQSCLMTDAKPTSDGFSFKIGFRGRVNDYTRFDIRKHDVFGCYLIFDVCENGKIVYYPDFEQLYGPEEKRRINPEFRVNQTAVFDRKGILKGDEVVTMGVFGL